MNNYKKLNLPYSLTIILVLFSSVFFSCKKFLQEDLTTARGMNYFETDQGIQDLVVGAYYQVLCSPFAGEWIYSATNYGTDEFRTGNDPSNKMWNDYDNALAPIINAVNGNSANAYDQWDNLYTGISDANIIIKNAMNSSSASDQIKEVGLGSGYFFRAYNYLRLVNQYGAVPLKLEPSSTVELEFEREPVQSVFTQIISDFRQAYNLLPSYGQGGVFRLNKDVAAHFLAKAYLTRASEVNDSWNSATKNNDLDSVIILCDQVIANHSLAPNYRDLWNYSKPDDANENLSEIVLSAQFTADVSTQGANMQHVFWTSRYDDVPQMQRDLTGDRPYSRLSPNYYMYNIYNLQDDSRFWKTFRTKHRLNNASGGYYANGDLGIMYVINRPGDNRFSSFELHDDPNVLYSKTGKTIPNVFVTFPQGVTQDGELNKNRARFPSLSKYYDGSRVSVNETRGLRDIILARSAETNLIAAEAKIRQGKYNEALPYINAIRKRAEWKSGENREVYVDGGQAYPSSTLNQNPNINSYMPENSYYESNDIAVTTAQTDLEVTNIGNLPAQDEAIISKLGYSSDYDRMMCFLLDEKSRELGGEYIRWEDLARTRTLLARTKAFNPDAAPNIQPYHQLRPIPQSFLDGIQKDGHALTSQEKQDMQNPGY